MNSTERGSQVFRLIGQALISGIIMVSMSSTTKHQKAASTITTEAPTKRRRTN